MMSAHIVESMKFPICIPTYDKFHISQPSCEEIIWVLHLPYVTDSLPPAEEDAVDLELEKIRVGVPPARRRDRGVQRDRRVELRHEPPHVLGRRLGRGGTGAGRPCAGA